MLQHIQNSNNSVLNWVYNTLYNQSTIVAPPCGPPKDGIISPYSVNIKVFELSY